MDLKMGPAPETPVMPLIAELSKFPTQTPTVKSLVNPRHQLSRKSVDVPVLTAQGKGSLRCERVPKELVRAELSLRIEVTRNAESAVNSCVGVSCC